MLIKPCVQQPTHLEYQYAKMLLEKWYGDPHGIYTSYRKDIKNWPPIKHGDAKSYQEFFTFLKKCNSLGVATQWNAMEATDTLCMLVSKLPNGVADRWNRKALMLQKKSTKGATMKGFCRIL